MARISGQGLFARALRGSALAAGGYAFSQGLRLVSNLILTRLLYPEAFGLMALVNVVLVGLAMFSDLGLGPAISQSRRGDEPEFLDTAWTLNVARGAFLWLATCAAALPLAWAYHAPDLAHLLPAAGLTLFIAGFNPTRIDTANRHLMLGRVTLLDIAAQVVGLIAMSLLAWAMRSVWALVLGTVITVLVKLALTWAFLPGHRNRLRWHGDSARELVHFGKWIFLSTACTFLIFQGDKAIFGAFLTLEELGIYNIGWFLAVFPMLLAGAVTGKVLIPLYRNHPPGESAANFARVRRFRGLLTGGTLTLLALIGLVAGPLVGVLYDPRYAAAAAVVAAMACVQMPGVVGMTYDQSALAAGDSRNFFLVAALRAGLQSSALLIGTAAGGLFTALLAQGCALVVMHLPIIWLARRHRAWDAGHDALAFAAAACLAGAVLWVNAGILGL